MKAGRVVIAVLAVAGLGTTIAIATRSGSKPLTATAATVPAGIDRPNPFRIGRTLVIPHGGGDALYPEDTLYAYEHSHALGGDVIDLDVQTTSDGVPVAMHDDTVDRTTNGKGNVHDMTFAEISTLDAGWSFEQDGAFPFRDRGLNVPSIRDVLAKFPGVLVTLDLKDQRVTAVKPVCRMVQDLNMSDSIYIGVDTTEQVVEFRKLCPLVRTSGTDAERQASRAARDRGDDTFRSAQTVSQPGYLAADGTIRITKQMLDFAHARNVAVLPWVIDDPATMQQLVDMGVDGIYTRRPDLLVPIVKRGH